MKKKVAESPPHRGDGSPHGGGDRREPSAVAAM